MLLAYRLVRLIEIHSELLASSLLRKLQASDKCKDFCNVPPEEFRQRVYEIYQHLGEWLLSKPKPILHGATVKSGAAGSSRASRFRSFFGPSCW